jgi:probable rRNA maturation factor
MVKKSPSKKSLSGKSIASRKKSPPQKRWKILLTSQNIKSKEQVLLSASKQRHIQKILKQILDELFLTEGFPNSIGELSLVFCDNSTIQVLNRDYRGKDKATDVLSFPQLENVQKGERVESLGDLVISVEKTIEQAKERKHSFDTELWRLLVHGLLHLLGYDHEKVPVREARRMRRKEDEILTRYESLMFKKGQ